jgi:hypothetical protein
LARAFREHAAPIQGPGSTVAATGGVSTQASAAHSKQARNMENGRRAR